MKLPAIMFYPGDWLRDDVSGCTLSAQGLWLRMIILMHDSERYGHLCLNGSPIPPESISRRCGCDSLAQYESLLAELEAAKVPSRTNNGTLFSRRMVKDDKKRRDGRTYGKKGGNPFLKKTLNPTLKGEHEVESEVETNAVKGSPRGLNTFWDAYPNKVGKGAAEKAWKKIFQPSSLLPQMLSSIQRQKASAQWQKEGGQYIPNPATWLNQKRWEDGGVSISTESRRAPIQPATDTVPLAETLPWNKKP